MNKKFAPLLYISLAFGIIFILLGIVLLLLFSADSEQIVLTKSLILLLFLGALFLFISIVGNHHKAIFFWVGLNTCFLGITSFILTFGLFDLTIEKFWPIYMVFCGISLFPSGFYSFKRLRTVYIFPSCLLFFLGCFFSLFSFDIISLSFSQTVYRYSPAFLILLGVFLILIFVIQRKSKNSFPYMQDDYDYEYDETDDEISGEDE